MAYFKALIVLFVALFALAVAEEAKREKKQIIGAFPTAYSAAYPYGYSAHSAYSAYPYSAYPYSAYHAVAAPAIYY